MNNPFTSVHFQIRKIVFKVVRWWRCREFGGSTIQPDLGRAAPRVSTALESEPFSIELAMYDVYYKIGFPQGFTQC